MQTLISVVIPTYNHAHFLTRALESLQNQTYSNWEAIVIDNHSTDATESVIETLKDSKIRLLKIHNGGIIAASRNKGIIDAKGEWIAFLDSDDWWRPEKLEECVNVMMDNIDFIYHDLKVVGQEPSKFDWLKSDKTRQLKKDPLSDMLMNGNPISNSSVVVRRKILEEVGRLSENPDMIGAEDFNLWLKIASKTNKFIYISKYLGFYEFHQSGISRKDMSECYRSAIHEFFIDRSNKQKVQIEAHILYMKGRYNMAHNNFNEARNFFKQSLKTGNLIIKIKSYYLLKNLLFKNNIFNS